MKVTVNEKSMGTERYVLIKENTKDVYEYSDMTKEELIEVQELIRKIKLKNFKGDDQEKPFPKLMQLKDRLDVDGKYQNKIVLFSDKEVGFVMDDTQFPENIGECLHFNIDYFQDFPGSITLENE